MEKLSSNELIKICGGAKREIFNHGRIISVLARMILAPRKGPSVSTAAQTGTAARIAVETTSSSSL